METTKKVILWDRLSIGNPEIDNDHKRLLEVYNDLVDLLGNNPPDPEEIIKFLKEWWINHILKIDLQLENYKKENALDINY